jgi:hypothetical protein
MKMSRKSIQILENFSQINKSIYLDETGYIKNVSAAKNVIGLAKIEEKLKPFAIFDLNEFVSVMRMFDQTKDIDFNFTDDLVEITQGKTSVTYFYSNPDHIFNRTKPYKKYFVDNEFKASFSLTDAVLQSILKASKIMKLEEIKFTMKDGAGSITLLDRDNSAANKFKQEVEGSGSCSCSLNTNNMNFIKGDYDVFVFERCVKFISGDLCYILLLSED